MAAGLSIAESITKAMEAHKVELPNAASGKETGDDKKGQEEVKEQGEESSEPEKEQPSDTKEPPKVEDKKTSDALKLYDLLMNPETVGATLQNLTQQAVKAGALSETSTKKEKEEVKENLLDELKKLTKEDSHFLIDDLGPALEYIIKKAVSGAEVNVKTLQTKLDEYEKKNEVSAVEREIDSLISQEKYKPYLVQMNEIMTDFPPSDGVSLKDYFEKVFKIASKSGSGRKEQTEERKQKVEERVAQNQKDQLPVSSSGRSDNKDVIVMNRRPTLSESTEAAAQGKRIVIQSA